jgi:hypothetical protein
MTRLLQAYAGSIGEAVPFIEGVKHLSTLGIYGESNDILHLATAGAPLRLHNWKQTEKTSSSLKDVLPPPKPSRLTMMRGKSNEE